MMVASLMAMARPWLVAWALTPLIDAPMTASQNTTASELSVLMRFRANHFDPLFDFGAKDGSVKHTYYDIASSWLECLQHRWCWGQITSRIHSTLKFNKNMRFVHDLIFKAQHQKCTRRCAAPLAAQPCRGRCSEGR